MEKAELAWQRSHWKQPSESAEQVDSSAEDSVLETGVLVESTKKHRRRREKEALAPYVRLTPMRIRLQAEVLQRVGVAS